MNAGNVSSRDAVVNESSSKDVAVEVVGAETPVSVVPVVPVVSKPSFSAVVAEQNVSTDVPVVHDENALPNRPLTAFFTPQVRLPASDVFRAFR